MIRNKGLFLGKRVLITGGTGSFGYQIVQRLLLENPEEIIIYSRDEKKQYDMKNEFHKVPNLKFIIGNVRDFYRVKEAMREVDVVFHAAALKQVPNCELNPLEAVKTNVLGAENVKRAAIENKVEKVIAIGTDKAVKPVNVMGMTKAIQERLMISSNIDSIRTKFICLRYGNVIGSRGSVIPFFKERLGKNEFLPVTNFEMTRFLLSLNDAIDLVFKTYVEGKGGEVFVKKMPAAKIIELAEAMAEEIVKRDDYPIKEVGIRPGEKIHEVLVSEEEMRRAVETDDYYIIFPYGTVQKPKLMRNINEYTSYNTRILTKKEIKEVLKETGWI